MAQTLGNIRFVAVARRDDDKTMVASFLYHTGELSQAKYEAVATKVFKSDRIQEYSRLTITDKEAGAVHYDTDKDCMYLVITAPDYPQRTVFKFLEAVQTEFKKSFGGQVAGAGENQLSKSAKKVFTGLCQNYDDLAKADKLAGVMDQVDQVKGVMQDNVEQMLQNHEKLQDLEDKADNMRSEAQRFKKGATDLKKQQWWKNMKLMGILGCLTVTVVAVVVVILIKAVN